jgi:aldehyde dehydrogenase (NAD+)
MIYAMTETEIRQIVENQRTYFYTGATLPLSHRIEALKKIQSYILTHEAEIGKAIRKDLGKSDFESYMCETGLVLSEITYMLKHIRSFAKEKNVLTPLAQFHSRSFKKPSPYGVALIMSPWNYPFLLTIDPLIDALAAGNTVVLKPSAYSPYTSAVIQSMIEECFDTRYVAVITGGRAENTCLLNEHFDYIFFTGSQTVGKEVMRHAAAHLTPVTLELGGKSPCIVEESANIKLAARRIVFGKYLNCGQTCVAPDYIYCDRKIKDQLLAEIKRQIKRQFRSEPLTNKNYGKIINEKHFDRITKLIDSSKVVFGGKCDRTTLKIEPTVMDHVTFDDAVMQEEIFGPILPILTYDSLDQAIHKINSMPHPLALYVFTSDKTAARKVTARCGFGGGCINDTIIHLATSEMGFGGFGESGMGSYHGKDGFRTFSHYKSIVDKKTWLDLPMRYQPYRKINEKLIHLFLK